MIRRIRKSLTFRLALPVVVLLALLGLMLYVLVLGAVSGFVRSHIQGDLTALSHEVYDLLSRHFDEATEAGLMGDDTAVVLIQGRTLGRIDDLCLRRGLTGWVYDIRNGDLLFETSGAAALMKTIPQAARTEETPSARVIVDKKGDRHWAYSFDFGPWNWRIHLSRAESDYEELISAVRRIHLTTGALVLLAAVLMVFVLEETIRRPVEAIAGPVRNGNAPSYRGVDVFEFLSDNVARMMDHIQKSEEKYRLVVDNTHEVIVVVQENIIRFVNPQAVYMVGEPRESILGRSMMDFIHPDDQEMVLEHHRRRLRGEPVPATYAFRVRDRLGSLRWVELHPVLIQWEGRPGTLNFLNDITARREAESRLQDSERRFRALAEMPFVGLFIVEFPSGRMIEINPRLAEIFNYSMEEAQKLTIWEVVHSKDHEAARKRIEAKYTGGPETNTPQIYTCVRKDGSTFPAEIIAVLVQFNGRPAVQGMLRDVTLQESMEQRLRQAQKMEAVGTLASGIAHDFNNLLQAIGGYAEMLSAGRGGPDGFQRAVAEIGKATQRASELTTSLLAFSRKLESRLRPVDLGRLIRETQGLLERSIPKMIRIDFHLEKGLTAIQADPAQVEQVLINLVVNARDAMPDGGHLTIETDMAPEGEALPPVSGDAASGPFVRLRVTDTGQGMDQRTLDHIYEPFFTTKATGQGTGLGLSIVYGIMKSHGGLIHCASQPQRGTRFTLLFPSTDQPVEDTAAPVDHAVPGGRETILLVDDEPALRELGQELLQDHGYRVFLAPSGELALQMVEANPYRYDLVLLDVIMPGMGGERCLEELLKRVPELKVILVSGFSASGSAREFMERGAKGFVFKPYRLAQLLRAIRAALDGEGEGGGPAA